MADWRDKLGNFLEKAEQDKQESDVSDMARFVSDVAMPAFRELAPELEKHGRTVTLREANESASILVQFNGDEEITYRVQGRMFPNGVLPYAEVRQRERKGLRLVRVESMLRSGAPDYVIDDIEPGEVIANFLEHYTSRVQLV